MSDVIAISAIILPIILALYLYNRNSRDALRLERQKKIYEIKIDRYERIVRIMKNINTLIIPTIQYVKMDPKDKDQLWPNLYSVIDGLLIARNRELFIGTDTAKTQADTYPSQCGGREVNFDDLESYKPILDWIEDTKMVLITIFVRLVNYHQFEYEQAVSVLDIIPTQWATRKFTVDTFIRLNKLYEEIQLDENNKLRKTEDELVEIKEKIDKQIKIVYNLMRADLEDTLS